MTSRAVALALLLAACGDDGGVNKLPDAPTTADAPIDEPLPIDADTSACTTADLSFGTARGLVIGADGTLYYSKSSSIGRVRPCQAPEDNWVTTGFSTPSLMLDPANDALYTVNTSNGIHRIDLTAATPTAVMYAAVTGPEYMTLGPDGALYVSASDSVVRIAANSVTTITTAALDNPKGLAFRADGALLVNEYTGRIQALTLANGVETGRTLFADQGLVGIEGIALDADGNVYVTQGDGGPFMVSLDATGVPVDSSSDGLAGQLDFGVGPLTSTDLYVARASGGGAVRESRKVAGAAVPWHAP